MLTKISAIVASVAFLSVAQARPLFSDVGWRSESGTTSIANVYEACQQSELPADFVYKTQVGGVSVSGVFAVFAAANCSDVAPNKVFRGSFRENHANGQACMGTLEARYTGQETLVLTFKYTNNDRGRPCSLVGRTVTSPTLFFAMQD